MIGSFIIYAISGGYYRDGSVSNSVTYEIFLIIAALAGSFRVCPICNASINPNIKDKQGTTKEFENKDAKVS